MTIVGTLLLGVLAPVRHIAAAVLSLCSDEALFTIGSTLSVDRGWVAAYGETEGLETRWTGRTRVIRECRSPTLVRHWLA